MKAEEAIEIIEYARAFNEKNTLLMRALDMAVYCLRFQATFECQKDHFPDLTKMRPLTLEELREMDGKPVWIHTFSSKIKKTNIEEWALVASSSEYSVSFVRVAVSGRMEKRCSDYRKTWLAYPYPLPHIDREAWEPCESCNTCENCRNKDDYNPYEGMLGLCAQCYKKSEFDPFKFCKECGRPLTEEAWVELEKRLRG